MTEPLKLFVTDNGETALSLAIALAISCEATASGGWSPVIEHECTHALEKDAPFFVVGAKSTVDFQVYLASDGDFIAVSAFESPMTKHASASAAVKHLCTLALEQSRSVLDRVSAELRKKAADA